MRDLLAYIAYMAIAAIALFGVYEGYNALFHDTNVQIFAQQYSEFKAGMNQTYLRATNRYGTATFTAANLITMGIAPQSMQLTTSSLTNPWNGSVAISGNANANWNFDNDNIPQQDCITILKTWGSAMGITQFQVASNISSVASASVTPVNSSDATIIAACANSVNGIRMVAQ